MDSKFPKTRLGDVLTPIERSEVPQPGNTYRLFGVKWWGEGVYEREAVDGGDTRYGKLTRIAADDIVINKIWVRHGSVAVVPENLSGCYGGNEFPTFIPDKSCLEPRWIHWLSKIPSFWELCAEKSFGSSGKNRIRPEKFLEIEIPLPPLEEQRRIVAYIDVLAARIAQARELRQRAVEELEALIASTWKSILPIQEPDDSWLPLGKYVAEIENGWSPDAQKRPASDNEWGVLKVGAVSFGVFNPLQNKALPVGLSPKIEYEVRSGDFLMSRANTLSLVGACTLVETTPPRLMLSDKIFRFRLQESSNVDKRYLDYVLKSPALRKQIEASASGTSPTMKNISKAKVLSLRVPPYNATEQKRIVAYFDGMQAKINKLKTLQAESTAVLNALLPSVLDRAFKGDLVVDAPITLHEAFGISERKLVVARILLGLARVDQGKPQPVRITPLMKHAFLVQEESHLGSEDTFHFIAYNYGPYTWELYRDLDVLKSAGYVSQRKVGSELRHVLNPQRVVALQQLTEQLSDDARHKIDSVVQKYRDLSHNDLLRYVYAQYPEYTGKSERQDIVRSIANRK